MFRILKWIHLVVSKLAWIEPPCYRHHTWTEPRREPKLHAPVKGTKMGADPNQRRSFWYPLFLGVYGKLLRANLTLRPWIPNLSTSPGKPDLYLKQLKGLESLPSVRSVVYPHACAKAYIALNWVKVVAKLHLLSQTENNFKSFREQFTILSYTISDKSL